MKRWILAAYLFFGLMLCGQFTHDTWIKCGREATTTEKVLMLTMWGPAFAWVIVKAPFENQPEESCYSK
jgi:hypothetical protein